MPKIDPSVLKRLRAAKHWSQEDLAEKTRFPGFPKIDKQTICRLEQGKQANNRDRTVQQLARALNTDPDVLTGKTPLPDAQDDDAYLGTSKLNFSVSNRARNALYIVGERYNVTHSEIVELAPFLFCWAAEASLRQRRERLLAAERACSNLQDAEEQISHLPTTDFAEIKERFAAELESIESQDLFAASLDHRIVDNTFSDFLSALAAEIGGDTTFDAYMWRDYPEYHLCPEEALHFVDGDTELADAIVQGHIALHEMPKDIRNFGTSKGRAAWARAKFDAYRNELRRSLERTISNEVSP